MYIEHIAIWVNDLENMRGFYESYFEGKSGDKYINPTKNFSSYFIEFETGCRLEIMHNPSVNLPRTSDNKLLGLTHFAISVASEKQVDFITNKIIRNGFQLLSQPRRTGDGYYESVVLDPEHNQIEITI